MRYKMLKELIPVIAILGGTVYMFNMSIESEDALFSNHIDDYLDNEMNVKALELVESIRTMDDESEAQAAADAEMEEFLKLLSDEKYLNKAIAIMNDKKEAENAAAISAQLERNKMIPGLSNIDHDGNGFIVTRGHSERRSMHGRRPWSCRRAFRSSTKNRVLEIWEARLGAQHQSNGF